MALSPGQAGDAPWGRTLIEQHGYQSGRPQLVADRADDGRATRGCAAGHGWELVAPPHPNRHAARQRPLDRAAYRARNLVERFFCRLKRFRGVHVRYHKLDAVYLGIIHLACLHIMTRQSKHDLAAPQEDQLDTRQRMVDAIQVSGIRAGDDRLMIEDVADWGEDALVTHTAVSVDAEGLRAPCAIAIVPDDQTASEEFIALAAEQAAERRRLHRLIVIAFSYDASVHTGSVQRGRLEVLKVQANRDFQIPGLEDKGSDHAFVMIGQPEFVVYDLGHGNIRVDVNGFDTYNPATGSVERGAPRDIDCWMIDTDYNGQSFYARRIHFPNSGNDKRLKRLRRRLGKHVDPELWDSMQSTRSAPFRRPTGDHARIAVRIITRTDIEMTVELEA